jgi:hydroxymethylpyrimidine pyrophosphatase-like HAD family hydrolase
VSHPPVQLVAVDLDGTVVRPDRIVSPRVRRALAACAARRIPVVVATARRWIRTHALLDDLGLDGHCIVAGGGAVRRIPGGHVELAAVLPRAVVAGAVTAMLSHRLQPMVGAQHGEVQLAGDARRDTPAVARYLARGATRRVADAELAAWPATRVLAMGAAAAVHAAARACTGLGARILVQDAIFTHDAGGERVLELHVMSRDKGGALRALCTQLGIPVAATMAIGDAPTDLPMLQVAGLPVVMGQAEPGMKRHGWTVAPPVTEDGAAWAIERFALQSPVTA